MGALTTFIHLAAVVHYGYGIKVYLFDLSPPEEVLKVRNVGYGPLKYLTFWDMLLQFAYFIVSFVNDLVGSSTPLRHKQAFTQRVRDFMFSTVVFSVGLFVSVSFWGLYIYDRKLIFPPIFDTFFPHWLNHNVHTTPGVGALLEVYLVRHSFPTHFIGFATNSFFTLFYLCWVCLIAYQSNHWVYPVLGILSLPARVTFIGCMIMLMGTFYYAGEKVHKKIWGEIGEKEKKQVQKLKQKEKAN